MKPRANHVSRRAFLSGITATAGAAILAACGGETATTAPTAAAAATKPAGTTAPAVAATTAPVAATTAPAVATTGGAAAATTSGAAAPAMVQLKAAKIRIAQNGSAESAAATQKILNDFKKVQPNITVEVFPITAPDWDGFAAKLLTQIAAGDVPDIINIATEGLQLFAGKGIAAPITDLVMRDKDQLKEFFADVHPSLIEAMMYDGQLYSLPDNFNAANIFYSKGAFQKHGVPFPSDTWKGRLRQRDAETHHADG